MDWEWSDCAEGGGLSCPLCQKSSCFPSAEQLWQALHTLAGGPCHCGVCGLQLGGLTSYLKHLTCHLKAEPNSLALARPAPPAHSRPPVSDRSALSVGLTCPHCPRVFKTARGRTSHMRAKHAVPNGSGGDLSVETGPCRDLSAETGPCRDLSAEAGPCRDLSAETGPCRELSAETGPRGDLSVDTARPSDQPVQVAPWDLCSDWAEVQASLSAAASAAGRLQASETAAAGPAPLCLARRGDGGRRLRRLLHASHTCRDCGRVFRLRAGLAAHRRLAHGDGACEQCAVCQRRFTSARRLQRHLAATHGVAAPVSVRPQRRGAAESVWAQFRRAVEPLDG